MLQKRKPHSFEFEFQSSLLLIFGGICEGVEGHDGSEGSRGCEMADWEIKEGEVEEEEEIRGSDLGPCDINSVAALWAH